MPGISVSRIPVPFNKGGGISWSSYWTTQIEYNYDGKLWGHWQPRTEGSVVKDGSNRISQMTDLSGNSRHFLQGTGANQPLWTSEGGDFDSNARTMLCDVAVSNPITIYIVINQRTYTNGRVIISNSNGSTYIMQFGTSPTIRIGSAWGTKIDKGEPNIIGEKMILVVDSNTTAVKISGNGGYEYSGTAMAENWDKIRIGATSTAADIVISEMLIRTASDTDEVKTRICNRLFSDNNITITDDDVIVLAGQSNALGRAAVTDISDGDYNDLLDNGYIYDNNFPYHTGTFKMAKINPGVNSHSDISGYFGIEQSLLKDLSAYLSKDVYITKYGVSGTQIYPKSGNDWHPTSTGELFDTLKINISNALRAMSYIKKRGRIKYFIWIQGEEDSLTETAANAYQSSLTDFFTAIRTFISDKNKLWHAPTDIVKIIICRISNSSEWTYRAAVRAAQAAFVTVGGSKYELFDTDSYTLQADNKHFTADSNIAIGKAIAAILKDL